MNEVIIEIESEYPCSINVNSKFAKALESQSDNLILSFDNCDFFNLDCMPLVSKFGENKLMQNHYYIKIESDCLLCENQCLTITKYFAKHYKILILQNVVITNGQVLESKKLGEYDVDVSYDGFMSIDVDQKTVPLPPCTYSLTNLNMFYFGFNVGLISGYLPMEKLYMLYLIELSSRRLLICEKCKEIENTDNTIKYLVPQNDAFNEGIVYEYEITEDSLQLKNNYTVFLSQPCETINHNLIAFAFFDSIKSQNFTKAQSFVCEELKPLITKNYCKNFFGDFEQVDPNPFSTLNEVYLVSKDKKFRNMFTSIAHRVIFDGDLISNIE